ncbi:MAG: flagellar hook capping FlgD N-terminal domain-containing protein [Fimbriimonadales bacterium]
MQIASVQWSNPSQYGTQPRTMMDTYQFLRLLIVELTSQNPMDPVKDRDFLAQMAQLNTAQQMERMGQVFNTFQAVNLIGREVEAVLANGNRLTGKVESVQTSGGKVFLKIENQTVPFESVRSIQ